MAVENSIGDTLWEWLHFPRMLRHRGIELLHSLAFTFPTTVSCATVVTIHDLFFLKYPSHFTDGEQAYLTNWTAVAVNKADIVIAVSDSTREACLSTYNISKERCVTIWEAAGSEFSPESSRAIDMRLLQNYGVAPPYILYVGELGERKNVRRLLGACIQGWHKKILEHSLVLVGSDHSTNGPILVKSISEYGVSGRVKRLGYVPDAHLPTLYRSAELSICVSLEEGFGLPAIEAMRCGTPLVVSDRPCFREVCGNEGAVFVDPLNERNILHGIIELSSDKDMQKILSDRGIARGFHFDWLTTAKHTLQAYEMAINYHSSLMRDQHNAYIRNCS